jgi:MoaA/NifB/PqqE/SkfB family radical SAM enzyme
MIYPLQMIAWEITDLCNLKCSFCYKGLPEKDTITSTQVDHILNEFPESIKVISLTGGEPTLSKHFSDILSKLVKKNKYVVITTNGVWKDGSKIINELIKFRRNVQVQVSIEGDRKIHDLMRGEGTYNKIIVTLEECAKKKIKTSIMFTVGKKILLNWISYQD